MIGQNDKAGLETLMTKYAEVFWDELGVVKGMKVKLFVGEPKFCRARSVP